MKLGVLYPALTFDMAVYRHVNQLFWANNFYMRHIPHLFVASCPLYHTEKEGSRVYFGFNSFSFDL